MSYKSILIIEDDEGIRTSLQELLEMEGYQIYVASNGKEALEILPKIESRCLILLDLMMPVMNGWEFLAVKTANVKIAPIPVVIVSAIDDSTKAPSAHRFIKKPIEFNTFLKIIYEYLK